MSVELVVPVHEGELLVVVLQSAMCVRQRDQDARVPPPRLTRRRLHTLPGLEELERARLMKERLGEIRLPVMLRHAQHEMSDVRALVFLEVLLGFFSSPDVPLALDELPQGELFDLPFFAF
jgi:hypothetical protein